MTLDDPPDLAGDLSSAAAAFALTHAAEMRALVPRDQHGALVAKMARQASSHAIQHTAAAVRRRAAAARESIAARLFERSTREWLLPTLYAALLAVAAFLIVPRSGPLSLADALENGTARGMAMGVIPGEGEVSA